MNTSLLNKRSLCDIIGPAVFDGLVFDREHGSRVNVRHPEIFFKRGYTSLYSEEIGRQQERLALAIRCLDEAGLPPVFLFTAETPWQICRSLRDVLKTVLGHVDIYLLPDFWAWFVKPEEAGWKPHRDKGPHTLDASGRPRSCTVWIPITNVTASASHIALLPRDRDPGYTDSSVIGMDFDAMVPSVVPLLCPQKGTVLVWDQNVLHWGTRGSHLERMSIAFEFQRAIAPYYATPLYSFSRTDNISRIESGGIIQGLPSSFEQRLTLVARQIWQYRHMHVVEDELGKWCRERLLKHGYKVM